MNLCKHYNSYCVSRVRSLHSCIYTLWLRTNYADPYSILLIIDCCLICFPIILRFLTCTTYCVPCMCFLHSCIYTLWLWTNYADPYSILLMWTLVFGIVDCCLICFPITLRFLTCTTTYCVPCMCSFHSCIYTLWLRTDYVNPYSILLLQTLIFGIVDCCLICFLITLRFLTCTMYCVPRMCSLHSCIYTLWLQTDYTNPYSILLLRTLKFGIVDCCLICFSITLRFLTCTMYCVPCMCSLHSCIYTLWLRTNYADPYNGGRSWTGSKKDSINRFLNQQSCKSIQLETTRHYFWLYVLRHFYFEQQHKRHIHLS